jgi:hypothetical protein
MDLNEANKLWFESKPIEGIKFGLNDYVHITEGEYSGNHASVISLMSLEPVTYLVELDLYTGGDVVVFQTEIENEE